MTFQPTPGVPDVGPQWRSDPNSGFVRPSSTGRHVHDSFDVIGGFVLVSPNGTKYRIKVADNGTLSTEVA